MTLILTEITTFGIAMAADSAVTYEHPHTGMRHARPNAARKLNAIPYLRAGVSCWGVGRIDRRPTDEWLRSFIETHSNVNTLAGFAQELADELNRSLLPACPHGSLGFHLAGFEDYQAVPAPSFYHIHDGRSNALRRRGIEIDQNQFNANHDAPPEVVLEGIRSGGHYITRNGDYRLYNELFQGLHGLFAAWDHQHGIRIPDSQNLYDRADYLVFQIRTVSEIYRLSNLVPGIGGQVHYMTVNPDGIHSEGVRHF